MTLRRNYVIEAELERVREYAGGTGVGGLRDDLFRIEVHVDQGRRPPCQPRAVEGPSMCDRRIVETLLDVAGADSPVIKLPSATVTPDSARYPCESRVWPGVPLIIALVALHAGDQPSVDEMA